MKNFSLKYVKRWTPTNTLKNSSNQTKKASIVRKFRCTLSQIWCKVFRNLNHQHKLLSIIEIKWLGNKRLHKSPSLNQLRRKKSPKPFCAVEKSDETLITTILFVLISKRASCNPSFRQNLVFNTSSYQNNSVKFELKLYLLIWKLYLTILPNVKEVYIDCLEELK